MFWFDYIHILYINTFINIVLKWRSDLFGKSSLYKGRIVPVNLQCTLVPLMNIVAYQRGAGAV